MLDCCVTCHGTVREDGSTVVIHHSPVTGGTVTSEGATHEVDLSIVVQDTTDTSSVSHEDAIPNIHGEAIVQGPTLRGSVTVQGTSGHGHGSLIFHGTPEGSGGVQVEDTISGGDAAVEVVVNSPTPECLVLGELALLDGGLSTVVHPTPVFNGTSIGDHEVPEGNQNSRGDVEHPALLFGVDDGPGIPGGVLGAGDNQVLVDNHVMVVVGASS